MYVVQFSPEYIAYFVYVKEGVSLLRKIEGPFSTMKEPQVAADRLNSNNKE